ncbi:PREDICTED: G-protein coupled receptor 35-like [Chrysochloris asiatica]|uniref:G-protein coupled receptor 35-like n=1 Tax=Chrysochloris asiatica TaxID=185453 RepID=A0A9B0U1I1_CHRAS|nr:PREDICTED: G-protein coupled receptor 35-like [Chrysochloris asiatica]
MGVLEHRSLCLGASIMNKSCNSTLPDLFSHMTWAYTITLVLLGLVLNCLALCVLCCRLPQWTETRVYMVNLAVADLCLVCALPFFLHTLKMEKQGTLFCYLSQGIYLVNRYMSISLIMAIAVDRYLAVCYPLRSRGLRSPRQAVAVCALLWVLVVSSQGVRWLLDMHEGGFCFSRQSPKFNSILVSLMSFYVPLAVLVFCSLQVVTSLARRPAADLTQAEATRKASRMIWANLAVFVACFLPLHLVLTVFSAMAPDNCDLRRTFSILLYFTSKLSDANCCLDTISYYLMAKEFQEASVRVSGAKVHKSQDSLSIILT